MKRLMQITLVAAVVAMTAVPALAQQRQRQRPGGGFGGGFGGGMLFLLGQKSVQEELKVSEEQSKKIQELSAKQRESFQGLRDLSQEERRAKMEELGKANQKAIAGILKPEQMKRARQISLQQPGAIANPEVAKALNITDEQRQKLREIQTKAREEMSGLRGQEDAAKKLQEIRKATNEKVLGVLTPEQKKTLKELRGEPFKGEIQRQGGRRNRQN